MRADGEIPMLLSPDFFDNPYPAYAALRSAGPLHFSPEFFGGAWLLTQHQDVALALRDPRLSARRTGGWINHTDDQAAQALAPFQQVFARALLFLDSPDHNRLRQAMMPAFRPAALNALRTCIAEEAASLLDAIDIRQPFDAMAALARPLPARSIARWLGVPSHSHGDFARWSDDIAAFIGQPQPGLAVGQRAQRGTLAMAAMFRRLLAQRGSAALDESGHSDKAHADDALGVLLQAQAGGAVESPEELVAQCVMLLFAGHETTRNLLGNGLHAVLSQPGAWQHLRQQPDALPLALRELLRFDSPVQYTGRRVAVPHILHGQLLQRGDLVIALIGAANRDPAVYTAPDMLQLDRREAAHLSFGTGPHVCIGAALTYLEAEVAFAAMLQRWPHAALAAAPVRAPNALYRGFASLPVAVSAG